MVTDIIDGHFDDIARDSRALIQKRKAEEIKWGDPDSKDLKASKSALIKAVKKMDAKQIAVLDYMLKRSGQNDFASLLMNMRGALAAAVISAVFVSGAHVGAGLDRYERPRC